MSRRYIYDVYQTLLNRSKIRTTAANRECTPRRGDMEAESASVVSTKLKGHSKSVLCLAHGGSNHFGDETLRSATAACLLSGSEDGTARLWDLRQSQRASLCIKTSGEVLSVSFGPVFPTETLPTDRSAFSRDFTVLLSVDNSVQCYDLRKVSSPIMSDPTTFFELGDEINQGLLNSVSKRS